MVAEYRRAILYFLAILLKSFEKIQSQLSYGSAGFNKSFFFLLLLLNEILANWCILFTSVENMGDTIGRTGRVTPPVN